MMVIPPPKPHPGGSSMMKSSYSSSTTAVHHENYHNQFSNPNSHQTEGQQQQQQQHKQTNHSVIILNQHHYQNYPNITPRAFPYWPNNIPLPCFDKQWNKQEEERARKERRQGLLFLKPVKVGSSTAMGVNLRIAEKEAIRQNKTFTRCTATHGHGMGQQFKNRIMKQSFLWSILRDPTSRVISEFFHFQVSREKVEPTAVNLLESLRSRKVLSRNYYVSIHDFVQFQPGQSRFIVEPIMRILNGYDFIGITERFDESLVVLQQLLRLPLSDILYLNAKRAGNYDDGGLRNTCYYITPSFITPAMKSFFDSNQWQNIIKKDMILYTVVNASLDLTIEETIGRNKFDLALRKFQYAQKIINDACSTQAESKFPCTSDGVKLPDQQTDCYHKDSGCGKSCIDRIVSEYDNNNNNKHDNVFS